MKIESACDYLESITPILMTIFFIIGFFFFKKLNVQKEKTKTNRIIEMTFSDDDDKNPISN
jgi:hypothetical protein